jgi:hypothetical protein
MTAWVKSSDKNSFLAAILITLQKKKLRRSTSLWKSNLQREIELRWSSPYILVEPPLWKIALLGAAPPQSVHKSIPLRKIISVKKNTRLNRTRNSAIFIKLGVKVTSKLKINVIRHTLNLKSIQWNHLQLFLISSYNPFLLGAMVQS